VAIGADGPLDVTVTNQASVSGAQYLLFAEDQSSFFPQATVVRLSASEGSTLRGDALAEPASIANIGLSTGSHWTGAALPVTNVSVDSTSAWTITNNSTVTQTVANAGLVEFVPPGPGPFHTLTTRDYAGTGGTVGLNTFLGDDTSPSDVLIINS